MAQKQGSSKKARAHKESKGQHGAGGKVRLSPLEKVLLVNGGMAHHVRAGQHRAEADRTRAGKAAIEAAQKSAAARKAAERMQKTAAKGSSEVAAGRSKR